MPSHEVLASFKHAVSPCYYNSQYPSGVLAEVSGRRSPGKRRTSSKELDYLAMLGLGEVYDAAVGGSARK